MFDTGTMRTKRRLASLFFLALASLVQCTRARQALQGVEDGYGGVCAAVHEFDSKRHKRLYRVGVLAIRGFEAAYNEFNKTFTDYLTVTAGQRFDPPIEFEIKPLNFYLLFSDVEDSIVDFIYVNPSAYSCIESEYTARSLASQISRRKISGNVYDLSKFGGVIAARAERDDINSIHDLKDKVIGAASISGLGSGQMQFLEMQRAGMSYINDPKQLVFTSNQGKVVQNVLSGDFDVGFIRTDQLERSKVDGQPVNVSDFKIIEPRTNFIDGVEFPFTASTALYPEWNLAALDHVPGDVSREVQTAMIAVAEHAKVGRAILDCYNSHNETHCDENVPFPYGFVDDQPRCDTNMEIALTAVEAMENGKYSGWQTTLSYMQLRSMQEGTGFIKQDAGTNIWRCVRSKEIYDAITCPDGFYRKDKASVEASCKARGLACKEGFQCLCSPCSQIQVCYNGVTVSGNCVPHRVFLPSLLVPLFVLSMVGVHLYVAYKRKLADAVWEIKPTELKYDTPVVVIGRGTFGYVHLAEFRGTHVAVKRILPSQEAKEIAENSTEVNPGLKSIAPGMLRRARRSGTGTGTISQMSGKLTRTRKQLKHDFICEMRHLAKLRHPCITTVMGAVANGVEDPMLIMEYMAFGSLYDVLRDESLQTQVNENQMQILQDIARGLRFLHAANPQVVHGDLKAQNVLVDANFHAKVSDFGLSGKTGRGYASGTPYWMAPELLEARSCNTAQSDIFAFGVLMFEIFSGKNPYEEELDTELVLEQICDRTINRRPTMPLSCPLKMVDLYEECLKWDPTARPTAEAIDLLLRVEGSVKERVFRLEKLNRELGEANAKIETASAMQLQHFACMSHEIRTPLNCIVGISSLMEEDESLSLPQRDNVKMIVSSGRLLRHIVDDVLDYSKLESGAMEVDIKQASLQDIITDSVASMASSPVTTNRNISIRNYYDPKLLPEFETDSRRLQQILYNLLSNAVKFSKEDGVVELSAKLVENHSDGDPSTQTEKAGRILRISVKDYGKGIEETEYENIFHPFTQTKTGINSAEGGTGLGLSITRKLVHGLGGSISVDCEVGKFSTFTIEFPHTNEVADVADKAKQLMPSTFVVIDEKSLELEQFFEILRAYNADYIQFDTVKALKESISGSSWSPSMTRTYICLVRCSRFDNNTLEEVVAGGHRHDIITFGCGKGLFKSSQHYASLTEKFPSVFVMDALRLAR